MVLVYGEDNSLGTPQVYGTAENGVSYGRKRKDGAACFSKLRFGGTAYWQLSGTKQ